MQVVPKLSATSQQSWMRREKLNAKNSTYFGQLFKSACKPKGFLHPGQRHCQAVEAMLCDGVPGEPILVHWQAYFGLFAFSYNLSWMHCLEKANDAFQWHATPTDSECQLGSKAAGHSTGQVTRRTLRWGSR